MRLCQAQDFWLRLPEREEPVLQGLTLEVVAGEILALVGLSGAGKTSLLRAMTGDLPQGAKTGGTLRIEGRVVPIFQMARDGLSPLRRLGDQIGDVLKASGRRRDEVAGLLAAVGLPAEVARLRLDQVSGGMAQRVSIARAMASGARLIVADEPTSALDAGNAALVLEALRQACREARGVLLVTHDLALARVADRIAVLSEGRIVEEGSAEAVLAAPAHPVTQALCAAEVAVRRGVLAPAGDVILQAKKVSRVYKDGSGIKGASFDLRQGRCLAILGPSGAGKTSLARAVAKLSVMEGGLTYLGQEIGQLSPAAFAKRPERLEIQMVFQEARASFDPARPVGEGLQGAEALCPRLGIPPELLQRRPKALSVGQAQRLALLRALLARPKVLVLDEPTASLDMIARAEVAAILAGLKAEGMALVLVTHDQALADGLADEVALCEGGRIISLLSSG